MICPHNYDCFNCPEGEDYDCDYDLSAEEIHSIEKTSKDSAKFVGKVDIESQKAARKHFLPYDGFKTPPEARKKAKAYSHSYYQKHKEECRQKARERYQRNKSKHIETVMKYQASHLDAKRRASLEYYYRQKEKNKKEE